MDRRGLRLLASLQLLFFLLRLIFQGFFFGTSRHIHPPFLLLPEALTFSPPGLFLLRLLLCSSLTSSATLFLSPSLSPLFLTSFFLTSPLISPSTFLLLLHHQSCLSSPDTPNLHRTPPPPPPPLSPPPSPPPSLPPLPGMTWDQIKELCCLE